MFAVIYRFYLLPEREAEYQALWCQLVDYFKAERGALGSTLHQTQAGEWIAYSRWPDKATRDNSWSEKEIKNDLDHSIQKLIERMQACKDLTRAHEEICLDVKQDFLLEAPVKKKSFSNSCS